MSVKMLFCCRVVLFVCAMATQSAGIAQNFNFESKGRGFRPPLVSECKPFTQLESDDETGIQKPEYEYYFGAVTKKGYNEYALYQIRNGSLFLLQKFREKYGSILIGNPTPPDKSQVGKPYNFQNWNMMAVNHEALLNAKVYLMKDETGIFFDKNSSVSIENLTSKKNTLKKIEYDLQCTNIFSEDNRYSELVSQMFKNQKPEIF